MRQKQLVAEVPSFEALNGDARCPSCGGKLATFSGVRTCTGGRRATTPYGDVVEPAGCGWWGVPG